MRQAAIGPGVAESGLQHLSKLGLRHTFTALAVGKIVETARCASARDEAQSAHAQTLMSHDMPESQNLTLLTGMLGMSVTELHASTFLVYSSTIMPESNLRHEQYNPLSEMARIALMLLACGTTP